MGLREHRPRAVAKARVGIERSVCLSCYDICLLVSIDTRLTGAYIILCLINLETSKSA